MNIFDRISEIATNEQLIGFLTGKTSPRFDINTVVGFDSQSIIKVGLTGICCIIFAVFFAKLMAWNWKIASGLGFIMLVLCVVFLSQPDPTVKAKTAKA